MEEKLYMLGVLVIIIGLAYLFKAINAKNSGQRQQDILNGIKDISLGTKLL